MSKILFPYTVVIVTFTLIRSQVLLVFFIIIQVLHILTTNLQSPNIISFGAPKNQPAKIFPKVIGDRNFTFEYYSLEDLEEVFSGS